jgi:membrane protein implicated in regulation of membrane protease activity
MPWWSWILLGLALPALELLVPSGFYLMFFGLAALCVGALVALDLIHAIWLQWVLFSALSIVALLFFRGPLLARFKYKERAQYLVDSLVGEIATTLEDLPPGGTGKAELHGTAWTARNSGDSPLTKGQRSRVVRVDGLTLWIMAE